MSIKNGLIKNITLTALFLAIGFVLPMLFGQIPFIGQMLLPMHIPIFLCALICGWKYSAVIAIALPILRSLIFGVPVIYPTAIAVALEMAAYGIITGIIYQRMKKRSIKTVYISMLSAMLLGRVVRLFGEIILLGLGGNSFAWSSFVSGVLLSAIPGIILQLVLIPSIMLLLSRIGAVKFDNSEKSLEKKNKRKKI